MASKICVFLSYARKDGNAAAARLRNELERVGFEIWRDIEDMQGGQAWKEQLRAALRKVDAVVVLLTPAAVASKYVEWEWENALTLEKRVIPLLIQPCTVPDELSRLHYHNLSTDQDYVLGFASLMRDLYQLPAMTPSEASPDVKAQTQPSSDRSMSIGGSPKHSTIIAGDGNTLNSNHHSS